MNFFKCLHLICAIPREEKKEEREKVRERTKGLETLEGEIRRPQDTPALSTSTHPRPHAFCADCLQVSLSKELYSPCKIQQLPREFSLSSFPWPLYALAPDPRKVGHASLCAHGGLAFCM